MLRLHRRPSHSRHHGNPTTQTGIDPVCQVSVDHMCRRPMNYWNPSKWPSNSDMCCHRSVEWRWTREKLDYPTTPHTDWNEPELTLLYPCSSNQSLLYKCRAVFGIARIRFSREMLSIDSISILNGLDFFTSSPASSTLPSRIVLRSALSVSAFIDCSLNWFSLFCKSSRGRIIAWLFTYTCLPSALHLTKMYSMVAGSTCVPLKRKHSDNLRRDRRGSRDTIGINQRHVD